MKLTEYEAILWLELLASPDVELPGDDVPVTISKVSPKGRMFVIWVNYEPMVSGYGDTVHRAVEDLMTGYEDLVSSRGATDEKENQRMIDDLQVHNFAVFKRLAGSAVTPSPSPEGSLLIEQFDFTKS